MNSKIVLCILSIGTVGMLAQAAPYYYYFNESPSQHEQAQDALQQATSDANKQVQDVASQAQEAVTGAGQKVADQVGQAGDKLSGRFQGHLSELYAHGSSAVKGVVDTVQPDIKHIGQDLSDAYQKTRTQVGKQIEPLAQTVRPYLDHAHKVVAPYVSQAREEVPKLIGQAKPALTKVGEQVRGGIQDVLKKINGGEQSPVEQSVSDAATKAADYAKEQQQQQHNQHDSTTNSIQKAVEGATA